MESRTKKNDEDCARRRAIATTDFCEKWQEPRSRENAAVAAQSVKAALFVGHPPGVMYSK